MFADYLNNKEAETTILFETFQKVLLSFFQLRMNGKPDAHDMTQTALLKIHLGRNSFNFDLSLKTWVFTIANRALIDHWRVSSKDKENFFEDDPDLENYSFAGLNLEELFEISNDLKQALDKLKPIDRSIVYLHAAEGLSMAEIAKVHTTTEGAIKVRAHRAYLELRALLAVLMIIIKVMK